MMMPSLLFGLCAFTMVCAVVLGGGAQRGYLSDAILQFLAVPLLLVALWRLLDLRSGSPDKIRSLRWELSFCGVIVLVPLLQLVPLPPAIWSALPGRQPETAVFNLLGGELPWMPISMAPELTWLGALSLIPPVAIFLGCILLSYRERRLMTLVVLAMAVVSAFVGLVQFAQGASGWFRFYKTDASSVDGFFGNRDHLAALLYVTTVVAAAWVIDTTFNARSRGRFDTATIVPLIASFITLVVLVAGQTMTRSRAGLGLTIVALLAGFVLAYFDRRAVARPGHRRRSGLTPAKLLAAATTLAVIFIVQFSLIRVMERFGEDPLADSRITFARLTFKAATAHMPFGTGMGTFVPVYTMFEKPEDVLSDRYVNRAHDDFLEVWLEAGMVGIALIGTFVIWWGLRSFQLWRRAPLAGGREIDVSLARAATIVVGLLMAHSVVDYPLRTDAMMAILAFACALLAAPPVGAGDDLPAEELEARPRTRQRSAPQPVAAQRARPRPEPVSSGEALALAPAQAGERQLIGLDWPEEWRKPAKKGSTAVNDRRARPEKFSNR
jgi:O-antigen ligase